MNDFKKRYISKILQKKREEREELQNKENQDNAENIISLVHKKADKEEIKKILPF